MSIPYSELHISNKLEQQLEAEPDVRLRVALATGATCSSDSERLGLCVFLSNDEDSRVQKAARRTLQRWDSDRLRKAIKKDSHSKVLEYIVEFLTVDGKVDQDLFRCFNLNERSAFIIARRGDERCCEEISKNRQQLLLCPQLYWELKGNPNCSENTLKRIESFLKMQNAFVEENQKVDGGQAATVELSDLEAEIEAALLGKQSPSLLKAQESIGLFSLKEESQEGLGAFSFDFRSEKTAEFSFDLSGENKDEEESEEEYISLEKRIKNMTVGHKIKLAFKGNKEARSILIRDTNKSVATAVVKSGRLTDGEVSTYAGNRNLTDDVIREIAANKEFIRKYPVKVALVNNPKTPVSTALGFVNMLHKKDLQQLSRNKNVSSVIATAALKRFKDKFRRN